MNCCNKNHDEQNKQQGHNKGHMSHMLMMVLCCAVPLTLLLLLPFIGSVIPGSFNVLRYVVPFLCPLMMVAMIPMMIKNWKEDKSDKKINEPGNNEAPIGTSQQSDSGSCH